MLMASPCKIEYDLSILNVSALFKTTALFARESLSRIADTKKLVDHTSTLVFDVNATICERSASGSLHRILAPAFVTRVKADTHTSCVQSKEMVVCRHFIPLIASSCVLFV